ncbi:MAG: hypothetical protein HGA31_06690 [Candidatus Moranbacteria bacterium]|nr:hypothetical protein [Candidatus Moranbacteria bacterium]
MNVLIGKAIRYCSLEAVGREIEKNLLADDLYSTLPKVYQPAFFIGH